MVNGRYYKEASFPSVKLSDEIRSTIPLRRRRYMPDSHVSSLGDETDDMEQEFISPIRPRRNEENQKSIVSHPDVDELPTTRPPIRRARLLYDDDDLPSTQPPVRRAR